MEQLDRAHDDVVADVDLAAALAVLPVDQRQMLVLRYAFGCSVREVADALGVPEGTVKSRVHRARQRLRSDGTWPDGSGRDEPHRRPEGGGHDDRDDSEVFDGRA